MQHKIEVKFGHAPGSYIDRPSRARDGEKTGECISLDIPYESIPRAKEGKLKFLNLLCVGFLQYTLCDVKQKLMSFDFVSLSFDFVYHFLKLIL